MEDYILLTAMSTTKKILIVEERDLLREKIAGIMSRNEGITMVIQVSSYAKLQSAMRQTTPDLVLGELGQLRIYCEKHGISTAELCQETDVLLYTDGYEQFSTSEMEQPGDEKVVDVRHIQQEVSGFLQRPKKK